MDYSKFKSIPIADILAVLNIPLDKTNFKCWAPENHNHHDKHPSVFITKTNRFFCPVCQKGGDGIDLVRYYYRCNFQEAVTFLARQFQIDNISTPTCTQKTLTSRPTAIRPPDSPSIDNRQRQLIRSVFRTFYDRFQELSCDSESYLVDERGLQLDLLIEKRVFDVEPADYKRVMDDLYQDFDGHIVTLSGIMNFKPFTESGQPFIAFPIEINGEIVMIQARSMAPDCSPRYRNTANSFPNKVLFNRDVVFHLKPGDAIYVVEGVIDALTLMGEGLPAVGFLGSGNFPYDDTPLMHSLAKLNPIFIRDNDEAGWNAAVQFHNHFPHAQVMLTRQGKDVNELITTG